MNFTALRRTVLGGFSALLLATSALLAHAASPLPPEKAFRFSAEAIDSQSVALHFDIAPGYYLYRDRFRYAATPPVSTGTPAYPEGESHEDEFFGKQTVFRDALLVTLPISATPGERFSLTVTAQGCSDEGICYPPIPYKVDLALLAMSSASAIHNPADPLGLKPRKQAMDMPSITQGLVAPIASNAPANDGSRAAQLLAQGNWLWIILGFFGFGLLLAFTPCVLPMLPILTSLIIGQGEGLSRGRAFALSLAYVLGMALTYSLAGIAAAASGVLLAALLQNIWVLSAFALLFVLLALPMFGVFTLQLPASWQMRLAELSGSGGAIPGVALMGALSALIVGPCVAAPLAGALLFIAKSGDSLLGGTALFAMALGMGAPLLVASQAAQSLLPRVGEWMEDVKRFFGLMLLGTAAWLLNPVLPPLLAMLMWAALLCFGGVIFKGLDPLPAKPKMFDRVRQGAGLMSLLFGALILVGALTGSRSPLSPLDGLFGEAPAQGAQFVRVKNIAELDAQIAQSTRPVMLDFYADWCVSCKEMEHYTFTDPAVAQRLKGFTLLQADVTANSADDRALLARFGLFGPPGIIFFAPGGEEIKGQRVIGYLRAPRFAQVLDAVKAQP